MQQSDIQVILVPYDSGHHARRMGAGPDYLWQKSLENSLPAGRYSVTTVDVENDFLTEIESSFTCCRQVAGLVGAALGSNAFPLVLSGNCMISAGTTAGLGANGLGVVWFDGHSDFWTPAMTSSGMLDGMGLAILNGQCWNMLVGTVPGFQSISADRLLHVGGRLSFIERNLLNQQAVPFVERLHIKSVGVEAALQPAFNNLQRSTDRVYLHLDLDVLDFSIAQANAFARPDGLTLDELEAAIRQVKAHFTICGCGIASFDPALDENGKMAEAVQRLVPTLIG